MNAKILKLFFITLFLLLSSSLNLGLAANQNQISKLITLSEIQQKIDALNDRQNLSSENKNHLLAIYKESQENLKEAESQETQAEAFKQSLTHLPLESKQLARQINEAENNLKNRKQEKFVAFPTDELEQRLVIVKTALSDIDAEISHLEGLIGEQSNRPQQIREKIAEIKNKQTNAQQEQQERALRTTDTPLEKEAKQLRLETLIRLYNVTVKNLELENISGPIRLQNHKDRMRFLSVQREQLGLLVADLENFLLDRRQQEIDKEQAELQQAEKAAQGKHPLILAATKENISYNRSLQDINKNMEQFMNQKNELDQRYKEMEKDFQSAEQKINLAGLSPALGNLLREQRRNLPQRKQFNHLNDNIQKEIAQASLETFRLEEAKKKLSDIGQTMLSRMEEELPADTNYNDKLKIRTELRMLLNDQKELVMRLLNAYAEYSRLLGDVDFSLQQMLASADKFSAYLDERLLWVPSAPVIDKNYLKEIIKSILWFCTPANWLQLVTDFRNGMDNNPFLALLSLTMVALHTLYKTVAKRRLQEILSKVVSSRQHFFSFELTVRALFNVLALSLYGPLVMAWLGGVLVFSGNPDFFTHAFAVGLLKSAISLWVMQFFYFFFKPEGVAEILFQWKQHVTYLFYSQVKWLRFVAVPCVFLTGMTGSDLFSEQSLALGRAALIIMMLAMAYMFHRLTDPAKGLGQTFYPQTYSWIRSSRYVFYALATLMPLVIVCFAVAGYYQSALQLQEKMIFTLRLIFITVLFHELVQGWLAVSKRQLVQQNARQKRKQEEQHDPLQEGGYAVAVDETLVDLSTINQQSGKLLTTITAVMLLVGCWMIWRDILSAFTVFDQMVLWQHNQILDGKESLQPVTLSNLLLSITFGGLTFVFVSNFPALVDLFLAGKYAITQGSRYALIQLSRYLLVSIAFLAIANELGGSWSQVQWLVAALSVGLGFGLQEIFANMVSGIILLFERPIRLGDTVTVGEVTGRVVRMQMRATHIVDYDRKELVVPNKLFITDRLINWTLSDTVTRIVITVGVAYGSEIALVEKVIREAIKNTPMVLTEPEPKVLLMGFGDSALEFNVHVYVNELSERLEVRHVLHQNVYEALQANHIDIPFPQRDIHIRDMVAMPVNAVAAAIPNSE